MHAGFWGKATSASQWEDKQSWSFLQTPECSAGGGRWLTTLSRDALDCCAALTALRHDSSWWWGAVLLLMSASIHSLIYSHTPIFKIWLFCSDLGESTVLVENDAQMTRIFCLSLGIRQKSDRYAKNRSHMVSAKSYVLWELRRKQKARKGKEKKNPPEIWAETWGRRISECQLASYHCCNKSSLI